MYNQMMSYYNAIGEPLAMWDGLERYEGAFGTGPSGVDATEQWYSGGLFGRLRLPSPLTMDISAEVNEAGDEVSVSVVLTPEQALNGNYELTIVLYQKLVTDPATFPNVGINRLFFEPVSFNGTDPLEITDSSPVFSVWDLDNFGVGAFIRDTSTREILQSTFSEEFLAPVDPPSAGHSKPFDRP